MSKHEPGKLCLIVKARNEPEIIGRFCTLVEMYYGKLCEEEPSSFWEVPATYPGAFKVWRVDAPWRAIPLYMIEHGLLVIEDNDKYSEACKKALLTEVV